MKVEIRYDGAYPSLCSGTLVVQIEERIVQFPDYCLSSGGDVSIDEEWSEEGEWSIKEWPENFPEKLKQVVLDKVNEVIPHGCCGGCT